MSNTNNNAGAPGLGLQILYKTPHQRKLIDLGELSNRQCEIEINLGADGDIVSSHPFPIKQYTIRTRDTLNWRSCLESNAPPGHGIVLRYSRALFLVLTVPARINESWTSQFQELVLDHMLPSRAIFPEHERIINAFITAIESSTFQIPDHYPSVYALSEIFTAFHLPNIQDNGDISNKLKSLILEIEPLIEFIADNGFVLPSDKIFRRITGYPKSVFLVNFARLAEKPFKYFINELKFRSEMTELIYTGKSNAEISHSHGYSEQSSFCRSIKNKTGMSPTLIRKIGSGDVSNFLIESNDSWIPSILN